MKRLMTLLMIAVFALNFGFAQEQSTKEVKENGAKTVFEKTTHNFGVIKEEKGPVTCEFKFTNEGDRKSVV